MYLPFSHFVRPFAAAVALFVSSFSNAATLQTGPEIKLSESSATITWTTDVATGTRLNYGTNDKLLTHHVEGELGAQHKVEIKELTPGTIYYFSVGTARSQLATGSFTTTGTPKKDAGSATAQPPIAPAKKPLLERLFPGRAAPAPAAAPTAAKDLKAPPTRSTWASIDSLQDHFDRHGGDFRATSPDDYAAKAWLFLQKAKQESLPMKWDDADSTLRVYDAKTGTFAAYDRRGKTRTFFKPSNPSYWQRQPGRQVKPSDMAN